MTRSVWWQNLLPLMTVMWLATGLSGAAGARPDSIGLYLAVTAAFATVLWLASLWVRRIRSTARS